MEGKPKNPLNCLCSSESEHSTWCVTNLAAAQGCKFWCCNRKEDSADVYRQLFLRGIWCNCFLAPVTALYKNNFLYAFQTYLDTSA